MKAIFSMLFLIIFGTLSSTTSKILVSQYSYGYPPDKCSDHSIYDNFYKEKTKFSKSFSLSLVMFMGMTLVYPTWILIEYFKAKKRMEYYRFPKRTILQFLAPFVPAFCDCTASTLLMFSIRYVAASTEQMLSGVTILFTALLSFIFLKKKIWAFQLIAILIAICAVILIGLSEIKKTSGPSVSSSNRALGVILIIVGFFVQSIQVVFLEKIVEGLDPLEIVGLQGFYGIIIVLVLCTPPAYYIKGKEYRSGCDSDGKPNTSFESIVDTFYRIGKDSKTATLFFCYMFILFFFNIGVLLVINYTSALNFTIVVTVRSLLVWVIFLIIGGIVKTAEKPYEYVEIWDMKWSWFQLIGFIVNLFATVINNRFIEFPCLPYPSVQAENEDENEKDDDDDKNENENEKDEVENNDNNDNTVEN